MEDQRELRKQLERIEATKGLTLENHPNCPMCGSKNVERITDKGACYCDCDCWSHPECLDCGYRGYMNSEGIYWHNSDEIRYLKNRLGIKDT